MNVQRTLECNLRGYIDDYAWYSDLEGSHMSYHSVLLEINVYMSSNSPTYGDVLQKSRNMNNSQPFPKMHSEIYAALRLICISYYNMKIKFPHSIMLKIREEGPIKKTTYTIVQTIKSVQMQH